MLVPENSEVMPRVVCGRDRSPASRQRGLASGMLVVGDTGVRTFTPFIHISSGPSPGSPFSQALPGVITS